MFKKIICATVLVITILSLNLFNIMQSNPRLKPGLHVMAGDKVKFPLTAADVLVKSDLIVFAADLNIPLGPSNISIINAKMSSAKPGDVITIENGIYSNVMINAEADNAFNDRYLPLHNSETTRNEIIKEALTDEGEKPENAQ